MASIRRISIGNMNSGSGLSNEAQAIKSQLGGYNETIAQGFNDFSRNTIQETNNLNLAYDMEDEFRIDRAENEGRNKGPLTDNQLAAVERFIDEAYFLLDSKFKDLKSRDEVIGIRMEALTQIDIVMTPQESNVSFPEKPKNNITIILLKAPKNQSSNARVWFENIKAKLDHTILFNIEDSDSDLSSLIGNFKANEEVRVYVERNYSAIHWKTITKRETVIVSSEIEEQDIYWDDYPLFENIQNEIFLRENESFVNCSFINETQQEDISYEKKINPFNFYNEENGWYRTNANGNVLNEENPIVNIDYSALLTKDENQVYLIDKFFKSLKALSIINLLNSPGENSYRVENNEFILGNFTSIELYNSSIKDFIKYKISDKILKVLNNTPIFIEYLKNLKLEIGIFKQLEKEGFLKSSDNKNSNIRVFYIKDEESGEIVPESRTKVIFNQYLEKHQISYKEILLSDGIENLPLEGIRSLLINNDKKFYYSLNNLIMKRFKNKDFILKYYYNYLLEGLESNISSIYEKDFSLPRNLIIKTKEEYLDIYQSKLKTNVLKWGNSESELLEVFINNKNKSWLNSDYHCVGYISKENDLDELYVIEEGNNSKNFLYSKIFPWQLVQKEFEITPGEYNENYHFTFYGLISVIFHEHIHAMQRLGSNIYVRNRTEDNKEVLFEDFDSEDTEFLLSEENQKKRFFYLGRFIYDALGNDYLEDFIDNEDINGFTSISSYENSIELYEGTEIIDGLNKSDYMTELSKEVYKFYRRFKGFAFAKGSSYIVRFIQNLFKNEYLNVGNLNFLIEGLAVFLTRKAFSTKFNILDELEVKKAKHFYFLSSSNLYREYLDFLETFEVTIEVMNANPQEGETVFNLLDIFDDTTLDNYVKDDYFKQQEKVEENFRIKTILYTYNDLPDFKEVFDNNDRFNKFDYQLVERNLQNNRLIYRSTSPNAVIQEAARPATSLQREEPRPQVTPQEAEAFRQTVERTQTLGRQLQNNISDSSDMQNRIGQETSDAVNTQYQ